ncbi:unnamed protein product, partial [Rhizoctonia solani]
TRSPLAAADTSHASLMSFVLAMVQHPHVQARAQEEIDQVTGSERLPNMADKESMPYVRCIVREVLRWLPPLPLGVPRATTKDDEYRGYLIPKGSIIMTNAWAMSRDESLYKSPETFDPERFLNLDAPSAPAFGFGRRSCPGNHYAEASLFILIASILAVFDIKPKINHLTGKEEIPEDEHITYAKWCKELGSDILSLTVLGQTIVVLNSVNAATELLDQRSAIYSDRPYLRVVCDPRLLDWGDGIIVLPYGPRWKKQRRIIHEVLKPSINVQNFVLFERETRAMLKRLVVNPEDFEKEFRRYFLDHISPVGLTTNVYVIL